ncbi:endonuclease/exonuclease/phosphatase family protein [Shewanella psychrotolerans]|uniref:endonuclease/exonuclease/phosphatase family protein n=1 Tax=Shewanella psychrotolerans TaxID=2864206 RepID=UPI001C65D950|nr:endonuclease/exonuclease/phosphatase family protein [Shewanella psychrotolerans]QYJ99749.1 endonuclease/exonuclease/phosphatase family protein [Shewanella psychrotolerans]
MNRVYAGLIRRIALALAFTVFTPSAIGHSGAKDENGGHLDRSTRTYHCHTQDCLLPLNGLEATNYLSIVSFNIQFLGNFKDRDDKALAQLLANEDIVVIQELVAPPYDGTFPDNTPYKPDVEARRFFEAMSSYGFDYILSEEDTGTNDTIHLNSAATEWFVTFFKPDKVQYEPSLPNGFLADDRSNNDKYERVPYASTFKAKATGDDFVLISVHLQPGTSKKDEARRKGELLEVAKWIEENDSVERDFFVLGDMNF